MRTSERSLAERVDGFRAEIFQVEEESKKIGGFPEDREPVRISLSFVAAILGAYDIERYTFYHASRLQRSFTEFTGRSWPSEPAGVMYETICDFVRSVSAELAGLGVPVRDLVDAQSFLLLRLGDQTPYFL